MGSAPPGREPLRIRLIRAGMFGFAVASPWSISISQAFAGPALVCGAVSARGMLGPGRRMIFVLWSLYGAASLLGAVLGPLPATALVASRTLLWGYLPFAVAQATAGETGFRASRTWIALWLASAAIASLAAMVRMAAWAAAGHPPEYAGSMTLSQLLLLASLAAGSCAFAYRRDARGRRWAWAGLLVLTLGMALQWKRGAWAAWTIGMSLLAAATRRRRVLAGLAVAVLATLAVPTVRERWASVRDEFRADVGGRGSLYRIVAPSLLRDYPWGVGPGATTSDLLRGYDERIPPRLSHLHSMPLQLLAESGPLGLVFWLGWWGLVVRTAFAAWRRTRGDPSEGFHLACWVGFVALFANGWVEFNFGDTEVMMAASVLAGIMLGRLGERAGTLHQGGGGL